ncbi:MAG: hypothetical protein AAGD33_10925 [Actinomycetota bacterium]
MEVIFERTSARSYSIEVRPASGPALRMDPAPGFDRWLPHDLQHFVVEEQLEITDGVFGRLAAGGTAATFRPVERTTADAHSARRTRRRQKDRDRAIDRQAEGGYDRSEKATFVATHDWLASCPDAERRGRASDMELTLPAMRAAMSVVDRAAVDSALPSIRARLDELTSAWERIGVGECLVVTWSEQE